MTDESVVRQLTLHGFDADEIPRVAALFDVVRATLRRDLGRDPDRGWWVPGRLEVFGKHTDYAGGRTLIMALPRGFAFAAASRTDGLVRIIDARGGPMVTLPVAADHHASSWSRYVAIVIARLVRNFPGAVLGADIAFVSNLPRAAGASSSSALTVGAAVVLSRLARLDAREEWRANLSTPVELAGYLACIENGMTFGSLLGGGGIGTYSGSEDHTAMLCAKAGHLSEYAFVPVRHLEDAAMPADWAFVVAASGVSAEKAGAAQALYNRASLSARALLDIWNSGSPARATLADALQSEQNAPNRLRAMIRRAPPRDWPLEYLDRRLAHFVGEDGRVPLATRAFQAADAARICELATASQVEADWLLENQVTETNALAELAVASGAWASCAFGAGFGGSVWALTTRADAETFGASWMDAYLGRFPHRQLATWFVARPGPPLLELSVS